MLRLSFYLLSRLPLPLLHILGGCFGRLALRVDRTLRQRLTDNMQQSGLFASPTSNPRVFHRQRVAASQELGKLVLETPAIWLQPSTKILALVHQTSGWEEVCQLKNTQPIIFLTPHLGSFEIAGFWLAQQLPISILYRPTKLAWLEPFLLQGRKRGFAKLAEANLRGVRTTLKALKQGESAGILPDQVPQQGEGVWAPFFGQPAYTMTLVSRLQQASGAVIVLVAALRLPHGKGFELTFQPLSETLSNDSGIAAAQINQALEGLIRLNPYQYLWSYHRYKQPRGVELPNHNQVNQAGS